MKSGIDPKVDYAFKKIFGVEANTPLLTDFVNAIVAPQAKPFVELEILNPFNEKDAASGKLSVLDIKARDEQGRLYNIEMQMFGTPVHLHRILYYWALVHSGQLREGENYKHLRGTISIAIVNFELFGQVDDFHLDFQLRSKRHPELVFSEQQSMHLLELPKFRKKPSALVDALDRWCYFFAHGDELDADQLPETLQNPSVHRAMEVLNVLSQNDIERERYQARLKWERDQHAYIDDAREIALKEGREEGREEGQLIGRIHTLQQVAKLPATPIDELDRLTLGELEAKAKLLEEQLGLGKN